MNLIQQSIYNSVTVSGSIYFPSCFENIHKRHLGDGWEEKPKLFCDTKGTYYFYFLCIMRPAKVNLVKDEVLTGEKIDLIIQALKDFIEEFFVIDEDGFLTTRSGYESEKKSKEEKDQK
jgi:hypothetical protein